MVVAVVYASVDLSAAALTDTTGNTANSWGIDSLDPPTGVVAANGSTITIDWTATTDTYASGHRVLRSATTGGPYTQVAEVTPRSTETYLDSPAVGTYYYVVRSFDGSWESGNSNESVATLFQVDLVGSWQTGLTHTNGSGSNRLLVFIASNEEQSSSGPSLTAVTYGGQSLTPILSDDVTSSSKNARFEIWVLDEVGLAAAAGTTIVPTWSGTPDAPLYSHVIVENVDQTTPTGAATTGSATGDTPNPVPLGSLATSDHDLVIAVATAGEGGDYTPQNGFLIGTNEDTSTGGTTALGTAYKTATGSPETASMLFNPASPPWINRQVAGAVVINVAP